MFKQLETKKIENLWVRICRDSTSQCKMISHVETKPFSKFWRPKNMIRAFTEIKLKKQKKKKRKLFFFHYYKNGHVLYNYMDKFSKNYMMVETEINSPKCTKKIEFAVLVNLFPALSVQKFLPITNITLPYWTIGDKLTIRLYLRAGCRVTSEDGTTWPAP